MKKSKKIIHILFDTFCLAATLFLTVYLFRAENPYQKILSWFTDEPAVVSTQASSDMAREEAFDFLMDTTDLSGPPGIPEEPLDHVFLNARAAGISSKLTGDVRVIVIFVNDPASSWTSAEMEAIQIGHEDMTAEILAEAASFGVNLDLSMEYHLATVDMELPDDDATPWADAALTSIGFSPLATASADLETEYGVDEAPILFYLNTFGRAYAVPMQHSNRSEYAIFFNGDEGAERYRHELYHLFGAKDYYYPADVEAIAEHYFPNSTMLVAEDAMTDDLTAYLIGWTDTLSEDALSFLQDTAYLTPEYMTEQHERETFTGYVEEYRDGDSTYTGYLDFGVPQGYGAKIWDDGSRYEGEWHYGHFHGEGTYTWANGNEYSGEWAYDTYHGYGTFTWADSGSYTGYFANGLLDGEGTYIWANGDRYTGEWSCGKRHGYGTYTWADGSEQTGYWENGEFVE